MLLGARRARPVWSTASKAAPHFQTPLARNPPSSLCLSTLICKHVSAQHVDLEERRTSGEALAKRRAENDWSLALTEEERAVFDVVLKTCDHFELNSTVPRVAGGWVRDKLLGIESSDVDVALNDVSGETFARRVASFAASIPQMKMVTGIVGVIKANPEQSKHLASATVRVYGREIDMVHLRTEAYTDASSRIPTISEKMGTPVEDAQRRDFTINALFYNLRTNAVEDFTGMGVQDLMDAKLRTPLPPSMTFLDDPLRMLRGVRFAARLAFTLDEAMCVALKDPSNHRALADKVSNERIGIEISGALRSLRPALALRLLLEHGLMEPSFKMSQYQQSAVPETLEELEAKWRRGVDLADVLYDNTMTTKLAARPTPFAERPPEHREAQYFAAATTAWAGETFHPQPGNVGQNIKSLPLTRKVIMDSLKSSKQLCDRVERLHGSVRVFRPVLLADGPVAAGNEDVRLRCARWMYHIQDVWQDGLELALATAQHDRPQDAETIQNNARVLLSRIRDDWNLENVRDKVRRPVFDGKGLAKLLGCRGPEIARAVEIARDFQFLLGEAVTDANIEDMKPKCEEYLRSRWKK